ncbi:hypothetical protein CNMCM5793_005621 [Aspergillus hiratsukae]|uniref:Reverse transcriptase domain-containing protein n=1 Tax=Aspergillus hiratsukae TaxID=1194566 RepID=A0A8H6QF21_9EURO|nr:hypothetical protein CNMCM5793_005621 [Aspergillus hiratsukae]KAF7171911.1 hypothetical protein CNMCM6106_006253 [Aspergillus hiratsukae]
MRQLVEYQSSNEPDAPNDNDEILRRPLHSASADLSEENTVTGKQVFTYKFDRDGYLIKAKARICVQGDKQQMTRDDTAATTFAAKACRTLMAIAAAFNLDIGQIDAVNAFVNSKLGEEVYTWMADRFSEHGYVYQLQRDLYSLRRLADNQTDSYLSMDDRMVVMVVQLVSTNDRSIPERMEQPSTSPESIPKTAEKGKQPMNPTPEDVNERTRYLREKERLLREKLEQRAIQKRIREKEAQVRGTEDEAPNEEPASTDLHQEVDEFIRQEAQDTENAKPEPKSATEIRTQVRLERPKKPQNVKQFAARNQQEYIIFFNRLASNFEEYPECILPENAAHDHAIDLKEGTQPPHKPLYPLSQEELRVLRDYIEEYLRRGWIRPSKSPAGAPILFAPKKDGGLRLCVDYRGLNEITVKNRYPLPLMSELMDRLSGAKIYTQLDLRDAYHRIRIQKGDEWKTAFPNAPATFQSYINSAMSDLLDTCCVIYLYDIVIYSDNEEDHVQQVWEVRKHGLYAKRSKCEFHTKEINFLGFNISTEGIKMEPSRVTTITECPEPRNIREVQQFLGYAISIGDLSNTIPKLPRR